MTRRRARGLVVCLLVAGSVLLAAGAQAYWRASGSGTGAGTTASVGSLTLTPGTPTAALFPGGAADVVLSVTNPSAATVHLGSLDLDPTQGDGGLDVDSLHAGCDVAALAFADQSNGGSGWVVPGRAGGQDGTLGVTLAGALSMDTSAADACQGASFTVHLSAGS